ncbi:MAG: UDP-N-acetylmuramoyl-L-alanine--D-glutamate ligase, partial [Sphaerospermopsis kisseleviana]
MPEAIVIGLGKSGIAAARLLKQEGWEVELCDRNTSPNLLEQQQELAQEQITVKLGHTPDFESLNLANKLPKLIVVSPGVPWDIPILLKARELGIETIGEMELAWRH